LKHYGQAITTLLAHLPGESRQAPVELSKKFDLVFDIRSANVTKKIGLIALELTGDQKILAAAVEWLRKNRVEVDPIELDVIEG